MLFLCISLFVSTLDPNLSDFATGTSSLRPKAISTARAAAKLGTASSYIHIQIIQRPDDLPEQILDITTTIVTLVLILLCLHLT